MKVEVENKMWSEDSFNDELEKVRSWYPTGREVDLDEAVNYHKEMPERRNLAKALKKARAEGKTLIGNRFGFATVEETIEVAHVIRDEGGCDLLGITTDTYSRRADFAAAEEALKESKRVGRSLLNGFPASIHGVKDTRHVYELGVLPISSRHGAATPQFHFLIALAAGATEANIGVLLDGVCVPTLGHISEILRNCQFTARMIGWYQERGVSISCQSEGYNGTLCPPYLLMAGSIIEMLLAAEQGAKTLDVMIPMQHCVLQDVAGLKVLSKLANEYLDKSDYQIDSLTVSANTFQEASPPDQARCLAEILFNVMSARWGGASRIMVKTAEEGIGTPSKEAQAMTMRAAKAITNLLGNQEFAESKELKTECELIERAARMILDRIFEAGDGDIAIGVLKAFEQGILDYPLAPSTGRTTRGKIICARDTWGAVRVIEPGNVPISKDVMEYEQEKLSKRLKSMDKSYQLVREDILRAMQI